MRECHQQNPQPIQGHAAGKQPLGPKAVHEMPREGLEEAAYPEIHGGNQGKSRAIPVQLSGHGLEKIPERLARANQHKTDEARGAQDHPTVWRRLCLWCRCHTPSGGGVEAPDTAFPSRPGGLGRECTPNGDGHLYPVRPQA